VLAHEAFNLVQFILRETSIELQPHGFQPELGLFPLAGDVHVRRFAAITRIEKETIGAALEDGRTHARIVSGSQPSCHAVEIRLTSRFSRGA